MTGPNDEWPILADPNPDDEEWPLQPNNAPGPPPTEPTELRYQRAGTTSLRVRARESTIVSVAYVFFVIGILDIFSFDDQSSGDDD